MSSLKEIRVFLASSQELKADRESFEIMIGRRNKDWARQGVHLRLEIWEDFVDAMSQTRLQDEYNRAIQDCDVFVMLFHTKVGKYTEEEFTAAFKQFQATGKPFIYTYFKNAPVDLKAVRATDLVSLEAFQARLKALGHFQTEYEDDEGLQLHFWQQLDKLVANRFIRFPAESDLGTDTRYEATVTGSGAAAQGEGATALGAGAVQLGGSNAGTINTGTMATFTVTRGRR
ncbi:MAG: toll/interleukin-1 receptor domain-containing protein [Burkholderiales bacterium]|jgi:hypothetical protein|nr:toll/interleukin-1 receptor domain-containing protein [Burkholderiales bacterium]